MKRVLDLLSQGIISGPDPLHIFGLPDVEKAFRLMQSGTNTGRIMLNSSKDDLVQKFVTLKRSWAFDPAASYVVAGGFGGIGRAILTWMDSVFENMSYTQWSTTIRSKVATSWNLHSLLPQDIHFFIMLSSIAGVCGSPGQSNYAAGCSFQDALARYRSATGCRGSVSVDIGRMRNIGIIAETEEYRRKRHDGAHMYTVEEPDFFALLEHYCDPCLGVLHTDHSQVQIGMLTPAYFLALGEMPHHIFTRPLFAGFNALHLHNGSGKNLAVSTQVDVAALFQQATTPAERSAIVVEAIAAKLARTLEVAPEQIDPHDSLSHYGTDSLMAVELRNWIRRDFGVGVAVFEIMGGASIMAIGDLVARKADEE
ncbi:putative secondary metabolism biosynthetic enzyme [Pestalotiopsis sp. IQ-011]